ncbi:MAG TPA: hypothetical protein VGD17_07575 [Chitinophagaceae bacterium]
MISKRRTAIICFFLGICTGSIGQTAATSIDTLDYKKIYGLAVRGEINLILKSLDSFNAKRPQDAEFKSKFQDRFKYNSDRTDYFRRTDTTLNPIHRIFQEYWREGLLNYNDNIDTNLKQRLLDFLQRENANIKYTDTAVSSGTLSRAYLKYIQSKGYQGTDFGKTGKFYDFIVWKESTPVLYNVTLPEDTINITVNFLSNFISLGWLEYARLGNYYPGGWATTDGLYCVAKAYDTTSEKFKVNFLKHEAQHFADYLLYPNLAPNDLEYRAKLIEVYYNENELYPRIEYFINNAKYDKTNSHPFANYCLIRDLSKMLFRKDWEADFLQWKKISVERLHQASLKALQQHSLKLRERSGSNTVLD